MLHAAIVGYGNIGPTHAAGLKTVEFANLSVICDIQADRAKIGRPSTAAARFLIMMKF